ncbi:MAG: hypothetical protein Q9165_005115 [Trypethelium subeluteriae]
MALETLMDYIAIEEQYQSDGNEPAQDSFAGVPFQNYASHAPFIRDKELDNETWKNSRKSLYLPCHYFDIIGGSSTGALIAIMLGRFRMSVPDCLEEYRSLAGRIFGKRRFAPITRTLVANRPVRSKYNHKILEEIFKDVARRRERNFDEELYHHGQLFRSEKGICGTFVTSVRKAPQEAAKTVSKQVIIRSYDDTRRHRTSRAWQAWEAARAATAADFYFDPFEIEGQDSQKKILYVDGGQDENNNPVRQAVEEVENLAGPASLGIVVSVGTARGTAESRMTIIATLKSIIAERTDPEKNHRWAMKRFAESPRRYFRLNDHGALGMDLDDWRPRKPWLPGREDHSGSLTLDFIDRQFDRWVKDPERTSYFQVCARELVSRRRARTQNPGAWEHFATGVKFYCFVGGCPETFRNRDDLVRHLEDDRIHSGVQNLTMEDIEQRLAMTKGQTQWSYRNPRQILKTSP